MTKASDLNSVRDEIRQRADIRDWALRAGFRESSGKQLHCKDHSDRTASVSVRGPRVHCFACNRWWDVFDLARELWSADYITTLRRLAGEYSVPWPSQSSGEQLNYKKAADLAPALATDIADWSWGVYLFAEQRKLHLVKCLHWAWENGFDGLSSYLEREIERIPRTAFAIRYLVGHPDDSDQAGEKPRLHPDAPDPAMLARAYRRALKDNPGAADRVRKFGREDREHAEMITAGIVRILAASQQEREGTPA